MPKSLIKPPIADLADELARAFAKAHAAHDVARVVTLNHLYAHMTPEARGRCDFARTKLALGGA